MVRRIKWQDDVGWEDLGGLHGDYFVLYSIIM